MRAAWSTSVRGEGRLELEVKGFEDDSFTVLQAALGRETELLEELSCIPGKKRADSFSVKGPLVLVSGKFARAAWAANVWHSPRFMNITSISDGAAKLRALQRNWALCPVEHHRRAALIQEKLPYVAAKPHNFNTPLPDAPLGAWTLWAPDCILASPDCLSPFPNGEYTFAENKTEPPNRAYLKLWELFTRLGRMPRPGELCIDLGGSPGGWAWVLQSLGARVFCVDKAPLEPRIEALPRVNSCQGSAFALEPEHTGAADWLFSDVICYPQRLLTMVKRWIERGSCPRLVCTLKFQAETDFQTIEAFRRIPDSRLVHLSQNKHELTWVKLPSGELAAAPAL